ncbi:hypothetical protein ACFQ08_03355 [Streptosporangium algeriense]|uniref:Uncharacterized protein n=1 Tax=Streptosporangium algeriense TaxID=1682748 RepID=A0ABW3DLX4_9ACTN
MENISFKRALVASSDLRGYGQGIDKRHETMQRTFVDLHEAAAVQAGLNRETWGIQPGGDDELAVLPVSEPDPLVVDQYVRALHDGLIWRNEHLAPEERFRLRVALAFGTAYPAANGYAGQAVVEAARLVNWRPLKRLFDDNQEAHIVLVLSRRVFEDVVLQGHTSYSEDDFHPVLVREKELSAPAWVWAPEIDAAKLGHLSAPTETSKHSPERNPRISQRAEVINNMNGAVKAREMNFGIIRK